MIYVGVPAYNERRTVGLLLWRVREILTRIERDFEMLVVDDASTDGTAGILDPYRRVLPLTVVRNPSRMGYAASVERLIREAVGRSAYPRRDAFVCLQADFSDAPETVPEMLRRFEGGVDLITVAREETAPSRSVRLARRGAAFLGRSLRTPLEISDPFHGFRMYRLFTLKRALEQVAADRLLRHRGWAANAELLMAVSPYVRQVDEVPAAAGGSRHVRASRFRAFPGLWSVYRMSRDRRLQGPRLSRDFAGAGVLR